MDFQRLFRSRYENNGRKPIWDLFQAMLWAFTNCLSTGAHKTSSRNSNSMKVNSAGVILT